MKEIKLLVFIFIFFQSTVFGMLKKNFKSQKIKDAIPRNISKRTFASMKLPITRNSPKINKKESYPDTVSIPQQNQSFWSQITSKIKEWLNIRPSVVYSKALTPGSFADLRMKQAAGEHSATYQKIKETQKNLFTPIGRRWYSMYKNEDRKFHTKYNDFTENDFIKEFQGSKDPEKLYRDLVKIYHPDFKRFSVEFCNEKTKDINNAFINFKEFKDSNDSNETIKKEDAEERKQTKSNTEGPIEDVNVKSDITQQWFKQKAIDDKYEFNKKNDLLYRDYFYPDGIFFYYQIELNSDDGSIKAAVNLTYDNEIFTPTNVPVAKKYQEKMQQDWLQKQMSNDKYYFNNKYKLKGRLRHIIENKYYELTFKKENKKVTKVTCLRYKEGEFEPTAETITQKTYQELVADGFSFDESNTQFTTNMSSSQFDKEALEKLMRNDLYHFNKKNNDKYRTIQYNNDELPRYYEFTINLNNGTYIKVIELIYKDGIFIEKQNAVLPSKEKLDDLFKDWIEAKMRSDTYTFNESNKEKFRYIIKKPNILFEFADMLREISGKKKREYPEPGYYEASINTRSGIITKIVKLTFHNGTFTPTNKVSNDEKIYKEIHNNWMKFIIENDMESFNKKYQNKQRKLYTSDPIQYYEAEFDVKNGTVIEAYWLDYKNGEFVKSTRKISNDELKKIYQIGSSNK